MYFERSSYFAELLGEGRAKELLAETLDEEKSADDKLTQIANSRVNRDALMDAGSDTELVSQHAGSPSAGRTKKR